MTTEFLFESFVSAYSAEHCHCGNKLVGEEEKKNWEVGDFFFF